MLCFRTFLTRNFATTMGKSIKPNSNALAKTANQRFRRPNRSRTFASAAPTFNAAASTSSALAPVSESNVRAAESNVPATVTRFSELKGLLDPTLLLTITSDLKFQTMMAVQAATLRDLLQNRVDMLAQAKTGEGKTIAFLLPAIQTMLNKNRKPGSAISLLVISPTRELALQIQKEAQTLLGRFPKYKVGVAIGGTSKSREEGKILGGVDILIATPGRLDDHLTNPGIVEMFKTLDTLVLDEADRLLDMGFLPALQKIVATLPSKEETNRQGMLFSATIAPHVRKVSNLVLGDGFKFVSTIPKGDANTHERVPQNLVIVPKFKDVAAAMVGTLKEEAACLDFKAVLFAPTAQIVDFYVAILENFEGLPKVAGIHSRHKQPKRTKTSDWFRGANRGILVATDVVARGMDFPGVSHVIQVGVPADKESYIHRLGRTARAGRDGRGIFILAKAEKVFAERHLKEVNFIPADPDLSAAEEVLRAAQQYSRRDQVYQSWLGYYKNQVKLFSWDHPTLVHEANQYALTGLGCTQVPGLQARTIGMMGLKKVPGLVVAPSRPNSEGGGGRGRTKQN